MISWQNKAEGSNTKGRWRPHTGDCGQHNWVNLLSLDQSEHSWVTLTDTQTWEQVLEIDQLCLGQSNRDNAKAQCTLMRILKENRKSNTCKQYSIVTLIPACFKFLSLPLSPCLFWALLASCRPHTHSCTESGQSVEQLASFWETPGGVGEQTSRVSKWDGRWATHSKLYGSILSNF